MSATKIQKGGLVNRGSGLPMSAEVYRLQSQGGGGL